MLYYPQLATGSAACYPLARTTVRRTVVNRMDDGSALKIADSDASEIQWELGYAWLSDAERAALESFFASCEGRLRTFTFFDPAGNLLAHSDDLSKNAWHVDGLILADGLRLTNGAQIWQGVSQTVGVPERFTSCFSADVRGTGRVRMQIGSLSSEYVVSGEWQTVWCSGSAEEVVCRMEIDAGATVEVAKLSLQAQPMPGEYRRTTSTSGVYAATRFAEDRIVFTAESANRHSTTVRLRSRG